jgi:DNA modification methylase
MKDVVNEIKNVKIRYENGKRKCKCCYCNKEFNHSVVPHLKKVHPEKWNNWCEYFVERYNEGLSYKKIMNLATTKNDNLILSWTVIEKEIKNSIGQGKFEFKLPDKKIEKWSPSPNEFKIPRTTIWDFPKRGNWAVHRNDYRGNWAPQIPRALIQKYTNEPGEIIFDGFLGGGTTAIEAWLNDKRCIGIDISSFAIKIANKLIEEMDKRSKDKDSFFRLKEEYRPIIIQDDIKNTLKILRDLNIDKVDLICTHPPYLDVLKYSKEDGDLSLISDEKLFFKEMIKIAKVFYKILKENKYCCILIGDVRKKGKFIPIGFNLMKCFQEEGFELEDIIIKLQHKDGSTEFYHNKESLKNLIAHEYLFIFKKVEKK